MQGNKMTEFDDFLLGEVPEILSKLDDVLAGHDIDDILEALLHTYCLILKDSKNRPEIEILLANIVTDLRARMGLEVELTIN